MHDLRRLRSPLGEDLRLGALHFAHQHHVRTVLELLELDGNVLDFLLSLVVRRGNGTVRFQRNALNRSVTLLPVYLQLLTRFEDLLIRGMGGHLHAPSGIRLRTLGHRAQPGFFDLHFLTLPRQRLVRQVGDILRRVPDALEGDRHDLHAEGGEILRAVLQQKLPEAGPFGPPLCNLLNRDTGLRLLALHLLRHPDHLKRSRPVQRAPEVPDHRHLDLLLDLLPRFTQESLHRVVEQSWIAVVDAHTRTRIGTHRDPIRGIHPFDPDVDGNDRQIERFNTL